MLETDAAPLPDAIAIIGLSGRFPGAGGVGQFWDNLQQGRDSIAHFSDAEIVAAGGDPARLADPDYVKAGAVLDGVEMFDAGFFGMSPREAEITDPQHRLFMECAWEALEDGGHVNETATARIGVYAGAGLNTYLIANVLPQAGLMETMGVLQLAIANKTDFMPTKVSYKLNLTGPSVNVNTACSTSLVAVHMACRSLLSYECDLALAGGVTVEMGGRAGYRYRQGGVASADGRCRAFDARADGTVCGSGAGVVLLKRLAEAVEDGDHIYAVIRGSAINNDGAQKVGYTAPGVAGQKDVIATALAVAEVAADTIGYVEAHGTGTRMGDPIEVEALTAAFRLGSERNGYCALGSVKPNVGHLDAAAGAASLIKAALSLKHRKLLPQIHFDSPNPAIDFGASPFYVNTTLRDWPADGATPRRAGVSSFGIGGTNAHAVLEEAPAVAAGAASRRAWQLLPLSARSGAALDAAGDNLARHLDRSDAPLADVAYTLQVGRKAFAQRRVVLCRDGAEACAALRVDDPQRRVSAAAQGPAAVVFMFPGVGDQYVGMAAELYRTEPLFAGVIDQCATLLQPLLGSDIRTLLCHGAPACQDDAAGAPTVDLRQLMRRGPAAAAAAGPLTRTALAHPALFAVEYALARLWMSWGVTPTALIGHSLGEYAAACLAGVMTLDDALTVVATRARLIEALPAGRMLAVALAAEAVQALLPAGLSLAAVNGPQASVVAGPADAVEGFAATLAAQGVAVLPVQSAHAFHSAMLEPVRAQLVALLGSIALRPPTIPYLSNVTGDWIVAADATDPAYWGRHTCQTVRFGAGVAQAAQAGPAVFIEMGPGRTLSSFVQQHAARAPAGQLLTALPSLPGEQEPRSAGLVLGHALGSLWCLGQPVDWPAYHGDQRRRRVPLPTYPFERQRHWLDAPTPAAPAAHGAATAGRAGLVYAPSWSAQRAPLRTDLPSAQRQWLVLLRADECGGALTAQLRRQGRRVVTVRPGAQFGADGADGYLVRPDRLDDYRALAALFDADAPVCVAHLWSLDAPADGLEALGLGYASLLCLAQAFGGSGAPALQLAVATRDLLAWSGAAPACAEQAAVLGPCLAMPLEYANVRCSLIDLADGGAAQAAVLLNEFALGLPEAVLVCRGATRWRRSYAPVPAPAAQAAPSGALRQDGIYLLSGYGAHGSAAQVARHVAERTRGRLLLVPERQLPARAEWAAYVNAAGVDAATAATVQAVLALERGGARVEVLDAATPQALAAVLAEAVPPGARLDGVFHFPPAGEAAPIAAHNDGAGQAIAAQAQRSHVAVQALASAAAGQIVFFSSMPALAGAAGQARQSALGAWFGALAEQLAARGLPARTVALDLAQPAAGAQRAQPVQGCPLQPAEADMALAQLLAADAAPQLAACPQELNAALAALRLARLTDLPAAPAATPNARGARPPYRAPDSEFEQQMAAIWSELFGVARIGLDDDFFNLGGSSLLAVQLIARLRELYQIELTLVMLFQAPTLRGASASVEAILLAELEGMSEADLDRVMAPQEQAGAHRAWVAPISYELPNKLTVQHFNQVETDHFYHDIFVQQVYYRNGITLNDGAVIFDVGANIGLFSLFASRQCKGATIYAFEPAPPVFQALQSNMQAHGVRARLFNCGVANQVRTQQLTFYPHSTGMSSFHADLAEEKEVLQAIMQNQLERGMPGMEEVMKHADAILDSRFVEQSFSCEMVTVSEMVRRHGVGRIDLLKIDVQKSELEVLEGIDDEHWDGIRQIVVEVHDIDQRVEKMSTLLKQRGYRVVVEQELLYQSSNISNVYGLRD